MAVDELGCFAIVRPDSDFETYSLGGLRDQVGGHVVEFSELSDGRFVDHPAHLKSANVTRHNTSFDERCGPARINQSE